MELSRLKIRNYRGISESPDINIYDFTTLIGPNNSSKSTVLQAINLLLSNEKPSKKEWFQENYNDDIEIEGEFTNISQWERNKPGISSLVFDNKINLKYIASLDERDNGEIKITVRYEAFKPEESIAGWSDSWTSLSPEIKNLAEGIGIGNGNLFKSAANKERVKQEVRDKKPSIVSLGSSRWTDEGISIAPALQQALPQPILIPAVTDAISETKVAEKNTYGVLLRKIILPAINRTPQLQSINASVKELVDIVSSGSENQLQDVKDLNKLISDNIKPLINAEAEIILDEPDFEKFISPNFGLKLNDGVLTDVNLQGQGLQRTLVFSLLEILANSKAKLVNNNNGGSPTAETRSSILLFEEPELYIHPHLIRKLKDVLVKISNKPEWQVISTTHSPFLINVTENPLSLVIFRKNSSLEITQLQSDPFIGGKGLKIEKERLRATIEFHPTVCEAFFAKNVVLVEGDTEIAVLKHHTSLFESCQIPDSNIKDCSVISCGGKWTIISLARLLKAFNIPLKVIHDLDQKGRSPAELENVKAIDPYNANQKILSLIGDSSKIFVCNDTFEDIIWPAGRRYMTSKDKPYRAWKRIEDIIKIPNEIDSFPFLKDIVHFAYNF